ncbi:unnamed protein product [Soboliphyme baturini]|uniref:Uncharacterized protein n=1 Tax=Soboliphyme baturini TaxID=241478 RepID=A0A183IP38_9BILA|nr:unnamed protein product [Soboliphyme baturini]
MGQQFGVDTCGLLANLANQLIYEINTVSSLNSGLRSELQAIMNRIHLLAKDSNNNIQQQNACKQVWHTLLSQGTQNLLSQGPENSINTQSPAISFFQKRTEEITTAVQE